MRAGRLKHRITIEKLTRVQSPLGPEEKWIPVETRWGRVALLKLEGRALYQEVGHSEVSHRVTLRGHVELTLAAFPSQPVSRDRKSTRLNSSHVKISYAVFCLKKKKNQHT